MLLCPEKNYVVSGNAQEKSKQIFEKCAIPKADIYGNGRGVRNLFEKIERLQANRLHKIKNPTDDELQKLEDSDIPENCIE